MTRPNRPTLAAALIIGLSANLLLLQGCDDDESTPTPGAEATPTATAPATTATAEGEGAAPPSGDGAGADFDVLPPEAQPEATATPTAEPTAEAKPDPQPKPKSEPKAQAEAEPKSTPPEPKAPPAPKPEATPPAAQPPAPPKPSKAQQLSPAKEGSADAVAERLDEIFLPIKHFRAKFEQKYTAKVHNLTKNSTGVLWVEKPNKISLSYHEPNENRAVSDGSILKVYEHENEQMFLKNVQNTEYPGAFAFILGKGLRQSFTFDFHKTSKWEGGPVLIGKPRIPNPGYKTVLFYIDESLLKKGDLGAVRRVLVLDAQGNRNRFDFIHASEPNDIPNSKFEFTPPKGTQIIKG